MRDASYPLDHTGPLFWDHWETGVLGQILAGSSREVTGTEGENGGKWRNGRKKVLVGDNQRK